MLAALHRCNAAELRAFIAAMPPEAFRTGARWALREACMHGWEGRARALLEAGASPNSQSMQDVLEQSLTCHRNENMARLLLDFGVSVRAAERCGRSVLYAATLWGNCRALELLLQHGADVDRQTAWGETALMAAAELGKGKQVKILLHYGANHGLRDSRGWTALLAALRYGRIRAVQALLEAGADVNVQDSFGRELLFFAFCRWRLRRGRQRAQVLRQLLAHGGVATLRARHGITPLHVAAWLGMNEELAVLLECTSQVDVRDDEGRTPLHYAARSGVVNARLMRLYGTGEEDVCAPERADAVVCDLLLEYGDPRYERYLGNPEPTPWAALRFRAQRNFGSMLLRIRNVGIEAIRGDGGAEEAAHPLCGKAAVARLLLERGADACAPDACGRTPQMLAEACNNESVARLLRCG